MSERRRQEIFETLQTIARERLEWTGPLTPESRLVEDLQLDSIRMLTLAMEVEDHFRICLDERDEESLFTLADLITLVDTKLEASK